MRHRSRGSLAVCEELTSPDAARFDDSVSRRGFEREPVGQRIGRGITGG